MNRQANISVRMVISVRTDTYTRERATRYRMLYVTNKLFRNNTLHTFD